MVLFRLLVSIEYFTIIYIIEIKIAGFIKSPITDKNDQCFDFCTVQNTLFIFSTDFFQYRAGLLNF